MSLITIRALGVTLSTPLFANLTLSVAAGDRIGLVAANGRGKSTLLKCITGDVEPTTGEIFRARGLTLGHMEQNLPAGLDDLTFREAVLAALSPEQQENESWRADVTLEELEVPEDLRERPLAKLSGGWQRIALIARVRVGEPDVLLLDEPTNHLDLTKIAKLEAWLAALPRDMPVVISSHDRAFLDAVTNRTLFLRPERSQLFALPYSRARAALDEMDAAEEKRFEKDMKAA